ncbi:ATP-binding cassette domain-containing protein [Thiotrichales bacterium 19X7-9]|nr:ATP-binding cassette domain-containing protein [Thiotrichales bacterium 19X7-9]
MHQPIFLNQISLSFADHCCFEDFTNHIHPFSRIAIIGNNGSGKSSLLNILAGKLVPTSGQIIRPADLTVGYVEQTISQYHNLSGGQRLNKKLSQALALSPDILLLDEPTNHLDYANRKSLMRMLAHYHGTLIIVTHDIALLNSCIDTFWHINHQTITSFSGNYADYIREIEQKHIAIEKELLLLKKEKKQLHTDLMKEQQRAAKSKQKGKKSIHQKKWPTVVSHTKASRSQQTSNKKRALINQKRDNLINQQASLHVPKVIKAKFSLTSNKITQGNILSIYNAEIGYSQTDKILKNINLTLGADERIAICGDNASGKSTLLKAVLNDDAIVKQGQWQTPNNQNIGYLDQHYDHLEANLSVIDHLREIQPQWDEKQLRCHLNDFLFSNNTDIAKSIKVLSGGEKARLSLCLIAARTPSLLILDEITNNLDIDTKNHVIEVLKAYPTAMIIISHEDAFLQAIGIDHRYHLKDGLLIN